MEKLRKSIYTLILALSLMVSIILIAKIFMYEPIPYHNPYLNNKVVEQETQSVTLKEYENTNVSNKKIVITDEQISKLISQSIPNTFPIEDIEMKIFADDTISVMGEIKKDKLISYVKTLWNDVPFAITALILSLPDEFDTNVNFNVNIDPDAGLLIFSPSKVLFNDISFPDDLLSPILFEELGNKVNEILCDSELFFTSIIFYDGYIELK